MEDEPYDVSIDPRTIEAAAAAGYSILAYPDGQVRFLPPRNNVWDKK